MLDRGPHIARLVAQAAPPVPVDRLIIGLPVDEAARLLPQLFNLCRAAQVAAMDAALGKPASTAPIVQDILRDHLLKLLVTWPGFFGLPPRAFPDDWAKSGPSLLYALFGIAQAPTQPDEFATFLRGGTALAEPLRRIQDSFLFGEAATPELPPVTMRSIWDGGPVENSVAARHIDHPVMRHIEERCGRGPLWRAAARIYDIEALCHGRLPDIQRSPGAAMVPAARGSYAIRIAVDNGVLSEFERVTPTDAILASGGILDRSLAKLPAEKAGLGALLVDILDPCCPVRLKEVAHA